MKMEKIYPNADLKLVNKVTLYPDTNGVLCFDEDTEIAVPKDVLLGLAQKGLILVDEGDGAYAIPYIVAVETEYVTVSYANVASATASLVTYYSEGYTA